MDYGNYNICILQINDLPSTKICTHFFNHPKFSKITSNIRSYTLGSQGEKLIIFL